MAAKPEDGRGLTEAVDDGRRSWRVGGTGGERSEILRMRTEGSSSSGRLTGISRRSWSSEELESPSS
jgi:hypothetical protein